MKAFHKLLLVMAFFTCSFTQAQVNVNVNLGTPPAWGPAGYTEVRYYYIPDIHTYYDVSTRQYIYLTNGRWVRATVLPVAYRNYNLYSGYKVVLHDYRGATPYVYYKTHKVKYPKGYKGRYQQTVGVPPGHYKREAAYRYSDNDRKIKVKGHGHKGKGHKHGRH